MKKFAKECDRLPKHMIVETNGLEGNSMMNSSYKKHETVQDGIKVILEVPQQSEDDEAAKAEVRRILTTVLREYLRKVS